MVPPVSRDETTNVLWFPQYLEMKLLMYNGSPVSREETTDVLWLPLYLEKELLYLENEAETWSWVFNELI